APLRSLPRTRGDHRPLAGHRAGAGDLQGGARHGRRLRARLVARARPQASLPHAAPGSGPEGHRLSTNGHNGNGNGNGNGHVGAPWPLVRLPLTPRIAVVGLGYWGPNLVRNLHELPDAELAAVCDARPAPLEAIGRRYPAVRMTTSFDEILTD